MDASDVREGTTVTASKVDYPRKRWSIAPQNPELARHLSARLNVHPIVGSLMASRGCLTVEDGQRRLDRRLSNLHDPSLLPGVPEGADRLYHAARAGRKICIYGDYDVDGMSATSILLGALRLAGADPIFYIPDRFQEGYGVNADALARLRNDGVDLVVTVDCGIASVVEAEEARRSGLEYIVTDHHEFASELPRADVVIHPRLPGSAYPFQDLCGTGVAFKLAWEFARRVSGGTTADPAFRDFLLQSIAHAAIGTVCDSVPMDGENRLLVHHGLQALKKTPSTGLMQLMHTAGLHERPRLDAEDIGFTLGPRLNACGRLGQARLGVELLTTSDPARAKEIAEYLDERNRERQSIERKTLTDAREMVERLREEQGELPHALVLASESWHPGVIGIVASRLVERYHRPTILIALQGDEGVGSGRSVGGVHLQQCLAGCSDHLVTSGGHAMAAGLRVRRQSVSALGESLNAEIRNCLPGEFPTAELSIDMETPLHALSVSLLKSLEVLEPFGVSNPKPMFMATQLNLAGEPRTMGGGNRHLSFSVKQGDRVIRAVAFGQGERVQEVADAQGRCCVAFQPMINDFRGYPEVELKVSDFRPGPTVDS